MRRLILDALQTERGQFHYIAPTYRAAHDIAWKMALEFCDELGIEHKPMVSRLAIEFPNGAEVQMLGVENADRLRGRYSHGLVLDEAAQVGTSVWEMVLLPMLADHNGYAVVCGTPAGWNNLLGDAFSEWECPKLRSDVSDTHVFSDQQLHEFKRAMSKAAYDQEMMVSFDAALVGAFYAHEMDEMLDEQRITSVQYDKRRPVQVACDLGWSDATACIYYQRTGNQIHVIEAEEFHFSSIPDIVQAWQAKPWKIEKVWLPHDARVTELGSGKTRLEQYQSLGCTAGIVRNIPIHDGIEAVRVLLPRVWIDAERGKPLIAALRAYRAKRDEVTRAYGKQPLHDWSSHLSDAARYLAVGLTEHHGRRKPLDYSELDRIHA